jgi:hypothetical protein
VIVDEHTIALGADLEPGTYRLMAGMYDEETKSRMPAYDAQGAPVEDGRIEITELTIESLSEQEEVEVTLPSREELPFTSFLPLVTKGASLPR